jgi:aminomethyltransferase
MENLRQTPLHGNHEALGARMVPFAGWSMPVQYSSILEEHRAVREKAGLFDVSHMGEALVTGPQARAFLDALFTNDLSRLRPGRALYGLFCRPDGGVVDDVIIYQTGEDSFFICLNASNTDKDLAWMMENLGSYACSVLDFSAKYAQIALQGPKALEILALLNPETIPAKRFQGFDTTLAGHPVFLARTGYTGEDGVEIYCQSAAAPDIWEKLLQAGKPLGLLPCGLGARDSLRIEARLPLYGHEIDETISPLEAGLGRFVKTSKSDPAFIGSEILAQQEKEGPARRLLWFRLPGKRIARQGEPVLNAAGEKVGEVRSGSMSPLHGHPIGSALVQAGAATEPLHLNLRGHETPLEIS